MRFDGYADLSSQELTPVSVGERAAEEEAALKAIHANWRDDVERTSVMQPKFLAPAYAAARAAGVSAPKPEDFDEDGPTGTYQERDLWPVTGQRGAPSPFPTPRSAGDRRSSEGARPSGASLPPRSSGIAMKPAPRYTPSRPAQTPIYTRSLASHVPTQVSAAPPAPPPPSADPTGRAKFPVPAAVWSSGSASTVPPRPRRINRASSSSAAKVPVQPEPARSSNPPVLPRRLLPPIGVAPPTQRASAPVATPPILLPRPAVRARAQTPGWFSPEDFPQSVTPPPPAALAEAPPLITTAAPTSTIFDPGQLLPTVDEPKPARARVILDALRTRIGPWTRHRTYVLSGVAAASICAGGLFAWTQRPAATPVVDPGPSTAEIARIMFDRTGFTVTTSPPGAWINVDGRPTGRVTPERVSGFTPGLHAIELKLPGYYDTSLPAVLEEGSTLVLPPLRLRPLPPAGTSQ